MQTSRSNDAGLPEIDTHHFEVDLQPCLRRLRRFQRDRPAFIKLIQRLVYELELQGKIKQLKLLLALDRAELYREAGDQWPSPRVSLAIYKDRYMEEQLLRHELGHEADRWNPQMLYDPTIEKRWKHCSWALNVAADISLDARLGKGGLGKTWRRDDFLRMLGKDQEGLFEEAWANPPTTWPAIELLAKRLLAIQAAKAR